MSKSAVKEFAATGVITTADGTLSQSNTVNLAIAVRAIRAKVAGTIKITGYDGIAATLEFSDGEARNVGAVRIWVTGTTATGIEGLI